MNIVGGVLQRVGHPVTPFQLHITGGGRLTHFVCVNGNREILMPCGRCRQLLFENGGPDLQLMTVSGLKSMTEVLPDAFGPDALDLS